MTPQGQDVEQRLTELLARARSGDREAFVEGANLATSTLKGLQHIKEGPAVALRGRLERLAAEFRGAPQGDLAGAEETTEAVQRARLHERVLAGDITAVDAAQPATFGRGKLTAGKSKLEGTLGIVKDCALIFIAESAGARNVRIIARRGELERVGMKGLLSKHLVMLTKSGQEFTFSVNRKDSSADELRRLDQIAGLWRGLGL
jgi:hypothetical protein